MSAHTDQEPFDLTQIPFDALRRLGAIFVEGDRRYHNRLYSEDGTQLTLGNWHNATHDKKYQLERANHALKHLLNHIHWMETGEYLGEVTNGVREDDLAKVMWFCATQIELERREAQEKTLQQSPVIIAMCIECTWTDLSARAAADGDVLVCPHCGKPVYLRSLDMKGIVYGTQSVQNCTT